MGFLSGIFGRADKLAKAARNENSHEFRTQLSSATVFVLADSTEVDSSPARTENEVLGDLEESMKELSTDQSQYTPFMYQLANEQVFPFFSTQDFAEQFIQAYVNRTQNVTVFQLLEISGDTLQELAVSAQRCLLNAESRSVVDCTHHLC